MLFQFTKTVLANSVVMGIKKKSSRVFFSKGSYILLDLLYKYTCLAIPDQASLMRCGYTASSCLLSLPRRFLFWLHTFQKQPKYCQ